MRLIDADELKLDLKWLEIDKPVYHDVMSTIDEIATVDAEPVKHGHWIRNDNGTYSCSECKSWIPNEQHYYARYCLFCGAKMDVEKENETG